MTLLQSFVDHKIPFLPYNILELLDLLIGHVAVPRLDIDGQGWFLRFHDDGQTAYLSSSIFNS